MPTVTEQYAQYLAQRTRKPAQIAEILEKFFVDRMKELDSQIDELAGSGAAAFEAGKKAADEFFKSKDEKKEKVN